MAYLGCHKNNDIKINIQVEKVKMIFAHIGGQCARPNLYVCV